MEKTQTPTTAEGQRPALTAVLAANGFSCTSRSTATLTRSRGTVVRTLWSRAVDGRDITVAVEQYAGHPQLATLMPGSRLASAGITGPDDLQRALRFHQIDLTLAIQ